MRKSKAWSVLALVVVGMMAVALVGGCTPSGGGGGTATEKTLKLGVHTSLTGGLADYGFAAQEGTKLAAKKFDNFKVGNDTYKIEIVLKDDKGEPAEAAIVAQSLVDDKVNVVIGCLTSGATNAAGPIYSQAGIIQISPSATRADLVTKGWKNFFRTCVGDNFQGAELAKWALELGFKKVVIFDDSGDYSVGLGDVVEEGLAGKAEVLRQSCKEGDTDFSAQVSNIKNFGADCVIFTGYHKEAGLMRKQMVENGLGKVQLMGGDGIKSDDIAGEAGGAANVTGALCTFGGVKTDEMPGFKTFAEEYKADSGKETGPYAETNYDAVGAYIAAVQKAGTTDAAAVEKAMQEIEYAGIIGTFGFNDKGEVVMKGASSSVQTIWRYKFDGTTWVSAD